MSFLPEGSGGEEPLRPAGGVWSAQDIHLVQTDPPRPPVAGHRPPKGPGEHGGIRRQDAWATSQQL